MITTILFALDGTLLPMNQDDFANAYVRGVATAAVPAGYEPQTFTKAIFTGTYAKVKNNGIGTNEDVFWNTVAKIYGDKIKQDIHIFDEFYREDFQKIQSVCGYEPKAKELIINLRAKGYRIVLATNPLFPRIATESRIRWAGLEPADFEAYTTFEDSHYCKPNPKYYKELLERLHLMPEECLMIGNDVDDDMSAATLGMKVFLLTDCLINKGGADLSVYPHGSYDDLDSFIKHIADFE